MVIYPSELEKAFNTFTDLVQTFALYRGKGSRDPEEQEGQPVGYLKGALAIYEVDSPGLVYSSAPPPDPVQVTVRVYIIKVLLSAVSVRILLNYWYPNSAYEILAVL